MPAELEQLLKNGHCIPAEYMQAYMLGTLPDKDQFLVEKHLLACAFCNDALDGLNRISADEATTALNEINHQIRQQASAQQVSRGNTLTRLAAVFALLVVAGVSLWYIASDRQSNRVAVLQQHDAIPEIHPSPNTFDKTESTELSGKPSAEEKAIAPGKKTVSEKIEITAREIKQAEPAHEVQPEQKLVAADLASEKEAAVPAAVTIDENVRVTSMADAKDETMAAGTATKASSKKDGAYNRGIAYFKSRNYSKAKESFEEAISENPDDYSIHFITGKCDYELKNFPSAIAHLAKFLEKHPKENWEAKWLLANAYFQTRNNEQAKILFREISSGNSQWKEQALQMLEQVK